jgi:peptide/nickel transport system substrate-binding protein
VIAVRTEPPSLSTKPLVSTSSVLDAVPLFNAELDRKDERGEAYPYLAEQLPKVGTDTWRVLPDGRTATTYRLKPGLAWHDGAPLTAEDFVFAWRVYATPELGASRSLPIAFMEDVESVDSRTFTIRWKQIYADADQLGVDFPPLPRHILEPEFANLDPVTFPTLAYWTTEFIGLGPYRLTRWEPGVFIEGEAFNGFVMGRSKIDRVKAQVIPDANTAVANVLSGAVQYVGQYVLASDAVPALEEKWGSDGGKILYAPVDLRGGWIQLRPEYARPQGLLDVRVRQALAHALDRATANEVLNAGKGVYADSCLLSPLAPYYSQIEPMVQKYPYDPRRTQQLMEMAGFPRGASGFYEDNGTPIEISVANLGSAQNSQENGVVSDGLRRAGFNAQMNVLPATATRDYEAQGKLSGVFIQGCGSTLDRLDQFTSSQIARAENHWGGRNRMAWVSAEYDAAYERFSQTLDRSDRIRTAGEMFRMLTQQVPVTAYWLRPVITAHTRDLHGPVARQTAEVQHTMLDVWAWQWQQ